jgi:chromatin structure-remodeling complex subunit RSC3/30
MTTPFPRSQIVQTLSVFASCLDSMIEPADGNYEVSQHGRKALRHVLDRVLADPVELLDRVDATGDVALDADVVGDVGLDDGMQILEWLDGNVDYRQEAWVNWLSFS